MTTPPSHPLALAAGLALGAGLLGPPPARATAGDTARAAARRARPGKRGPSGFAETPRPGDSRFPAEPPRPTGALLARLPAGIQLVGERLRLDCDARGLACRVYQRYRLRNTGRARVVQIGVLSPTVPRVRLDGRPASLRDWPETWPHPARDIRSSNKGLHPDTRRLLRLPGPRKRRRLHRYTVRPRLEAGALAELTLVTQSVAGFDRESRARTQPEVSFLLSRRRDPFTYHHEIRLRDPEARRAPGGEAARVDLIVQVPSGLDVAASVALRCHRRAGRRTCSGQVEPGRRWIRVTLTEHRRFPLGGFVTLGAGFTHQGAEAWLRAGLGLQLRSRQDVLALAGETDARRRLGVSLSYQLFLPYAPSTQEMGGHAELGLVLDMLPRLRAAVRLGAAFHVSVIRLSLLADLYPDALAHCTGPGWRILLGAGLGI